MFNKTTFGQPTTTGGFGASNPFGQSTMFNKPATTGFAQPAFGATGTSSGGLFGSTLPSSGTMFGSSTTAPAFGQAPTTQPSFGFGAAPQPASNLFGAQPTTATGLFGSTQNAFAPSKPAFGSTFGQTQSTGLFGVQQQQPAATPLFGATASSPFGATTSGFGVGTAATPTGTVIKFQPVTGTDTLQKGTSSTNINIRHYCITCMKEYEGKSLEELRFEDYSANRKGPQAGSSLFGATSVQPSVFGASTGTTGMFGAQPTENKSLFGSTTPALGGGFGTSTGVFGSQPTTSASLFGAKPTAFGAPTTSSAGFGFGAAPSTGLFNTTQPAFGAAQTTPALFGQTSTAQPATSFGATTGFGTAFGAPQNQTIGLFGAQNKPATSFGAATATPSTGFSFGQTTQAGTSLFGAKPATSAFGSTFGTAGSTFGTPATGASLFNKPATNLNFSFGGGTTGTGLGGNTLNTGTSLFGATQQKPGGLFGTTPSTGLFGATSTGGFNSMGTTFGQPSMGLGGSTLGGTSMFGSAAPAAAPAVAPAAQSAILALASLPFADSPLYRSLLPATKKTDNAQKPNALTQKAIINAIDMKVSPKTETKIKLKPLMVSQAKKSLFEGLDEVSSSGSAAPASSVRTLTLKPRSQNYQSMSLTDSLSEAVSSNKENRRVSFSLPLETPVRDRDSEPFHIRRNPLFKPNMAERPSSLDDLEPAASSTIVECENIDSTPRAKPSALSPRNTSEGSTSSPRRSFGSSAGAAGDSTEAVGAESGNNSKHDDSSSSNVSRSLDETHGYLNDSSGVMEEKATGKTGIVLRRVDYYTIPSLEELEMYVADDGSCVVDGFCIGRYGYGNLYYDEPMDVAGLDIDSIVHFRHKEVNVYPDPDESGKPEVGTGLNRKCQVTLERVFPIDKKTREPITDPQQLMELRYEDKLRRCTSKLRAHFVEYRPLTGSWVFKVDHFSKYGLDDSEDEVEPVPAAVAGAAAGSPKPKPQPPLAQKTLVNATPPHKSSPAAAAGLTASSSGKTMAANMLSPISPPKQQCFALTDPHAGATFTLRDRDQVADKSRDVSLDVDMDSDDDVAEDLLDSPWSMPGSKVDSHRVQLMKSSLFHSHATHPPEEVDLSSGPIQDFGGRMDLSRSMNQAAKLPSGIPLPLFTSDTYDMAGSYFSPRPDPSAISLPVPRPKVANLKHPKSVIPLPKSTMAQLGTRLISDIALYKGRSFRPGWGPSSTVTCLTTERVSSRIETSLGNRLASDFTPTHVQTLSLYPMEPALFRETVERHLEVELEFCQRGIEDGCPMMLPVPGVDALHRHCLLANELMHLGDSWVTYSKDVWGLCGALWGDLSALSPEDEPTSHRSIMMRREALTEWLRTCTKPVVEKELENAPDLKAMFSRLTGQQVLKACEMAQNNGEHNMALLLSSGPSARALVQTQLEEWTDVAADRYIDPNRLRLYTLAAGLPVAQISSGIVNACQGLDWRRVFALHYWYTCSPVSGIPDVVSRYESSFTGQEVYADPPYPPYCDDIRTSEGQIILDLCFHLLKLFSSRSHPLEPLLNPATHTADPLDLRLSWLLEQTLTSLGYSHVSALSSAITSVSFAAQLEAYGLWHWSIFVLLHLKDTASRKKAVEEYLHRHVALLEERELTTEEEFVIGSLGVPQEWVFAAKAVKALSLKNYDDAAYYLLEAGEWNRAHELIIAQIAPDLVINENVVDLEALLVRLVPHSRAVAEWAQQGQLLLDFLDIRRTLARALDERDTGQLEARLPQLASVCDRVVKWPTPTVKHRLCQAEIAKKTAHIYLNVKQLDCTSSALRDARSLISHLPLPDDYLLEEMEMVTRAEQAVL